MRLVRFTAILYFGLYSSAWGLASIDLLQAYEQAKVYCQASDYVSAQDVLGELKKNPKELPKELIPYVTFYYGLSAYYLEDWTTALHSFQRLAVDFPLWDQQEEVLYWLGLICFEQERYEEALSYLSQLKKRKTIQAAELLRQHFLSRIEDIKVLHQLHIAFPQDRCLAELLFSQLVRIGAETEEYDALRYQLAEMFQLDERRYQPAYQLDLLASCKKDRYRVAVLLPFFLEGLTTQSPPPNAFVLELYEGIRAAIAALESEGIAIDLFVYDTKKDPATTAAILQAPVLSQMDLLIGPLYAETIPLVQAFSLAHKINFFNPLSSNRDIVTGNPFAFLFKTSWYTQAERAASYTLDTLAKGNQKIGIIHGHTPTDHLLAETYKQYITSTTDEEVTVFALEEEDIQSLVNAFREAREKHKPLPFNPSGLTHLYIASQNTLFIAEVLSVLTTFDQSLCVLVDEVCLQTNRNLLASTDKLDLHVIAPNYVDYSKEKLITFRKQFHTHQGYVPTYYVYTGYDLMYFVGHMLAQYGTYFQKHWEAVVWQEGVLPGVQYGKQQVNQQVPIVRMGPGSIARP